MAIKEGSEWTHVETLTPVTVIRQFSNSLSLMVQAPVGPMFEVTEARFESDYARNEPVTLELLERMGGFDIGAPFPNGHVCASPSGYPEGVLFFDSRGIMRSMRFADWLLASPKSGWTVRELLNVLRVFGVETPGNTLAPPR